MPALETVHADATFRIVFSRNVQVTAMSRAPSAEQMRTLGRAGSALARRHPSGVALINLITGDKADFSEDMREETIRLMKRLDLFRLGSAHAILVGGFTGTAIRAFMSTALLLGRPPNPHKIFGDTDTAAAWLAPLLTKGSEQWAAAELVVLTNQVRAI